MYVYGNSREGNRFSQNFVENAVKKNTQEKVILSNASENGGGQKEDDARSADCKRAIFVMIICDKIKKW